MSRQLPPSLQQFTRQPFVRAKLASLLWLCVFVLPTFAQYRFDQWTINEGLPQNTVNAIAQTRDGYLWLATNGGLVRFDGVRFRVFNHSNTPGIVSIRFTSLYEDKQGALWTGSEDGYLTRLRD